MGLINRQSIVDQFNSQVANRISPSWHSGNVPSYASASLFGQKPSVGVGNISDSNPIRASTVVNNLASMTQLFTNVRNCRRILTWTTNGSVRTTADETRLAAMNNNYRQSFGGYYPPTPNPIQSMDMSALYNRWNALKNNTVTLTYNTHSEHSSHSSRSRR